MAKPPFSQPQGLGSPSMIGEPPSPQAPPPMQGEPDSDDMGGPAAVKPEAVHYHDDPQSCSMCEYMGEGGQCAILKMQVNPEGGCAAFENKNEGGEEMAPDSGMEPPQSGGYGQ